MNNNNFIGPFKNIAPLYIEYKRSLGFNSESEYNELKRLDKYFYNKGITEVILTKDMVEEYGMLRENESPILCKALHKIGNYTSQIFANIYLNELDWYIKNKIKHKWYYRYMDDEILLVPTKKEAINALENIKEFLKQNLKLELNNKTQIFKGSQGVNFCGYKIKEYNLKIRDKGKKKLKKKIKELKYNIRNRKMTYKDAKKYLCGHIGYIQIADINGLTNKLFYM